MSKRGSLNLMDSRGYVYIKKDTQKTRTYWECYNVRRRKCQGKLSTVGSIIVNTRNEHNHLPPDENGYYEDNDFNFGCME